MKINLGRRLGTYYLISKRKQTYCILVGGINN